MIPKTDRYGHPRKPLWKRIWLRLRYPTSRFYPYDVPPCPYD